ncbi:MAG: PAS domain S-box protein [Syntrophobacterales bacterium]
MKDIAKSKNQLIKELKELQHQIAEFERLKDKCEHLDETLRENRARYKAMFKNAMNGIAIYSAVNDSADFIFVDFNRAAEKIENIKKEALIGKSVLEIFPGIKAFGLFEVFQRVWATGKPEHHPVGIYKDARIEGWRENYVYKLPSGEIVAAYSDETERKRAEEELRKSTQALGERVKELNCLYGIADLAERPGISTEEIIQGTVDLIPAGLQYPEIACARIVLGEKEFRSAKFEGSIWKQTTDIIVHGNPIGTLAVHYLEEKPEEDEGPFLREERSLINAIAKRLKHIIEHREADEALSHLASIVKSSDDAIIGKTLDGVITSWNTGAETIYGYSAEEALGRSISILLPPDHPDEIKPIFQKIATGENVVRYETVRVRKDGKRINVSLTVSPIEDKAGKIIGASTIARDISERKRIEEALRETDKLVTVGRLAAGVAHSIRNPLTSVKMRLFSMERSVDLSENQREDLKVIAEEIRNVNNIVQSFLDFSRRPKLKMQRVSFSDLVDMALRLLEQRFDSYGVEIEVSRQRRLPEIWADPDQLKEALVNLLVNSCEAMGNGGLIVIQEEEVAQERSGREVVIRITDNGPGIPESIQDKLFNPFFSTKEEGTGLGLSITVRIVEEHGGTLKLRSREGEGATFVITLPYREKES